MPVEVEDDLLGPLNQALEEFHQLRDRCVELVELVRWPAVPEPEKPSTPVSLPDTPLPET